MPHDLIIRNGNLVDGTGAAPIEADIAIAGGRISAIGARGTIGGSATRVIDAKGFVVTPGSLRAPDHSMKRLFL